MVKKLYAQDFKKSIYLNKNIFNPDLLGRHLKTFNVFDYSIHLLFYFFQFTSQSSTVGKTDSTNSNYNLSSHIDQILKCVLGVFCKIWQKTAVSEMDIHLNFLCCLVFIPPQIIKTLFNKSLDLRRHKYLSRQLLISSDLAS